MLCAAWEARGATKTRFRIGYTVLDWIPAVPLAAQRAGSIPLHKNILFEKDVDVLRACSCP